MAACNSISRIFLLSLVLCMALPLGANAREVRVGIGFSLPPYVIRESDSGLEVDLIRESFALSGITVKFIYLPNLRLPVAFANGEVDCICANAAYDLAADSGREVYGSVITLAYQNYAISLEKSHLSIESMEDLKDKRVLGFNNATKYLGPEFAAAVADNPQYTELADQSLQVRMLYSGRVDVVISDKRIFLWWRSLLRRSDIAHTLELEHPPVFNSIFVPASRRLHFGKSETRDAFNRGFELFRDRGGIEELSRRYLGE